jgi:hypothetical protein
MDTTDVAREQSSCPHGCAYSCPESGVQNTWDTITTLPAVSETLKMTLLICLIFLLVLIFKITLSDSSAACWWGKLCVRCLIDIVWFVRYDYITYSYMYCITNSIL